VEPLPGVEILQGDMNEPQTVDRLRARLGGPADAVISDMAPNATGHKRTDQLRVLVVVEAALDFAEQVLAPGGMFLAKTMQSGGTGELAARLNCEFRQVRYVKPPASRSASAETYVLATGYRGSQSTGAPPESD
jgi:23S rRNA (uridine2552-2'-O)-methyltransferase